MDITHPAATAALTAMNAVTACDRDTWLSCYADDAVLYDPVGGSPLDPQNAGIRGRDALRNFWQQAIAPNRVRFDVAAVHTAGREAAVVATVTTRFPDGSVVDYDGVFVYAIDQDGHVDSMRGYWDVRRVLSALGL